LTSYPGPPGESWKKEIRQYAAAVAYVMHTPPLSDPNLFHFAIGYSIFLTPGGLSK